MFKNLKKFNGAVNQLLTVVWIQTEKHFKAKDRNYYSNLKLTSLGSFYKCFEGHGHI